MEELTGQLVTAVSTEDEIVEGELVIVDGQPHVRHLNSNQASRVKKTPHGSVVVIMGCCGAGAIAKEKLREVLAGTQATLAIAGELSDTSGLLDKLNSCPTKDFISTMPVFKTKKQLDRTYPKIPPKKLVR